MKTMQRVVIYYLVAAYVLYMAFQIGKNKFLGDPTFTTPMAVGICGVLGGLALGVIGYASYLWMQERKKTKLENIEDSESK